MVYIYIYTHTAEGELDMALVRLFPLLLWLCLSLFYLSDAEAECTGCEVALASYLAPVNLNSTSDILSLFKSDINFQTLQYWNPFLHDEYFILTGSQIRVPFTCDCLGEGDNKYLGHIFQYPVTSGDTYEKIASSIYENLTTTSWLERLNSYDANSIPKGGVVNVSINCSCGNAEISKDYGLFLTYPLTNTTTDNLSSLSQTYGISSSLLRAYNPSVDFAHAQGIAFVPNQGAMNPYARSTESAALIGNTPQGFTDITVDKSVEFTYQELAKATNDFSIANKIGEGGFGAVYYGELHGEKAAIKKMDMQATTEFLAELKVLTHVHHSNLVHLIGFCTEECLFLVYEFIENGTLSQHLRGSGMEPLSWPARVQIALDSARGLEYIHEHTVPVYIHRDIKSANILIDKTFRAKVADFGLTKLTEVGGASATFATRLVGTFGYMPPEYAQFGDVSPKVDVFAFGVVLYEIISAKEAVVKIDDVSEESKGLVTLFGSILDDPNGREDLRSLIDLRLGNSYPLESVRKMAQLARACTQESPQFRPSMRSVVVALMTLSSSTEDWDVGSFCENQAIVNLMGR